MRSDGIISEQTANIARKEAIEIEKDRRIQNSKMFDEMKAIEKIVNDIVKGGTYYEQETENNSNKEASLET